MKQNKYAQDAKYSNGEPVEIGDFVRPCGPYLGMPSYSVERIAFAGQSCLLFGFVNGELYGFNVLYVQKIYSDRDLVPNLGHEN